MAFSPVQTSFRVPLDARVQTGERVELLAPAGSFEALVAAVENGADAIYLAGQHFGARKFAKNFADEELRRGIDFAHVRGVKVFVTVNTLVFNDEFRDLVPFLATIREAGADAVIVQDIGVMRVLRELFPDLPLHISTQATVHNSLGVKWLEDLGAERAILAREMTLNDITQMKEKTGAELETFVHGALCYCYSGQCLMSSVIGERSGNRGACAYTCRLPFSMKEDEEVMENVREKHVLSSKDLNQIESIPQLIQGGVTSFKIEGRMKRPEYVAVVVRAYRNAIDRYYAGNFHITPEEQDALMRIFNREFTPGYLEGKEKWAFTNWDTAGNRGTPLGEVVDSGAGWVRVKLFDVLRVKDGIEILHLPQWGHEKGGHPEEYGFTVKSIELGGRYVMEAYAGSVVELKGEQFSREGDKVYKTADIETLESARGSFQGAPQRRVGIETHVWVSVGEPIRVTLREPARGFEVEHASDYIVAPAKKAPLTRDRVREQFEKMGESVFDHTRLDVEVVGDAFSPLSELNEARRAAIEKMERRIAEAFHRAPLPDVEARASGLLHAYAPKPHAEGADASRRKTDQSISSAESPQSPRETSRGALKVAVNCWRPEHVPAALEGGAQEIYFSGLKVGGLQPKWDEDAVRETARLCEGAGARLWLSSGMIQKDWEVEALRKAVRTARESSSFAGVLAGNHGACQVAKEEGVPFVVDWPMNVYNSVTTDFLVEHGAQRITLSPELTLEQMHDVAQHTSAPLEALVHGRLTLMTSEYCSIGHATKCQMPGGTWAPCHDKQYALQDRLGKHFQLETDGACRMYILNSVELAMLNRIPDLADAGLQVLRIESIGTHPEALREQVGLYRMALDRWNADPESYHLSKKEWKTLENTCPDGFTTGHFYRGPA